MLVVLLIASSFAQNLPIAWGVAASAYQTEGAWNVGGKGPSVWDKWYNDTSRKGRPNAITAIDHYNRMEDDISLLGKYGVKMYRFSVAWSRILPNCSGAVNLEGVAFYSKMIDEIIKSGALPVLTM